MGFPSVAITARYFGTPLPGNFQFWLDSCGYNTKFDWLFFTDADTSHYSIPANVHIRPMSLDGLTERLSAALGLKITTDRPYKVCDYRPIFWVLLRHERPYDFWGHCDLDMTFGDLGRFVTAELLAKYDKLFACGHLTLYRNCPEANEMFRRAHRNIDWRDVLTDTRNRGFDEHYGVNLIWQAQRGRVFNDDSLVADVDPSIERFECVPPNRNYRHQIFYFDNGHIYRLYYRKHQWMKQEFMLIHFPRRRMNVLPFNRSARYVISSGGFYDVSEGNSISGCADRLNPYHFKWQDELHRKRAAFRAWRRNIGLGPPIPPEIRPSTPR
jgi:hypothetical protein